MVEEIGERRRRFLELIQAKEMVEVAHRAKNAFLAAMSHELHTPMNAVLGLLNTLKGTPLNLHQFDIVEKSENAAKSLLGLLDEVLEYASVESGKPTPLAQPFRLGQLLRELAASLSANRVSESVEVLFDVEPRLPEVVSGDSLRLKQVLIHLGNNAVKFTTAGEVVVSVRLKGLEDEVAVLEFGVSDTGCGVAANQQERIFEAFTQIDASATRPLVGAGLGLTVSRRLVELMGGTLQVQSTLGVGSKFFFSLPLRVVLPVPQELQLPRPALPPALEVLVVDDNALACRLMVGQLQVMGVAVTGVDSGVAALQRLQKRCQMPVSPFTVVLLDWQMPGMDGWETARQIKALDFGAHRPPRLIMVSANGRDQLADRTELEQARVSGFLTKPFSAEMLLEIIAQACEGFAPNKLCPPGQGQPGLAQMRILVVEDNFINQMVAKELLSREGALVAVADNGQLGVEAVASADPPFDAVLMDLQMPVLDGFAATRAIRQQLGLTGLPIIALTANSLAEDIAMCHAAGMNDHVGKPFELGKLVALLRRHAGWTEHPGAENKSVQAAPLPTRIVPMNLHEVAKIDLARALDWVGSDTTLYRRFTQSYLQDIAGYADRLAQHLARREQKDAARIMHTLKGLSVTVGANQLADFAAKTEMQLKHELLDPQSFADLVQQTRDGINAVSAELRLILKTINATVD